MVDGVVLLDVTHDDPRLDALRAAAQPGALVGLPRDTEGVDVFDLDFGEAARMLVDHLYGLGHREIILVSPPRHVFDRGGAYAWRFRDAAVERAARYGIQIYPYYGESQQPGISRSLNAILDARPTRRRSSCTTTHRSPCSPLCSTNAGSGSPTTSRSSASTPRLRTSFLLPYTAVETSPDKLGREAVQHLVRRISDPDYAPTVAKFIEPELTIRGSTA